MRRSMVPIVAGWLVVAGTADAVLMVESEAQELSESEMLGAVMFGHRSMQPVLDMIIRLAEKAAKVFVGAAQLGGPIFLSEEDIARIAGRPDEAYRQRVLKM